MGRGWGSNATTIRLLVYTWHNLLDTGGLPVPTIIIVYGGFGLERGWSSLYCNKSTTNTTVMVNTVKLAATKFK